MDLKVINSTQNVVPVSNKAVQEPVSLPVKAVEKQEDKEGDNKLALTLTALAAVGAAAIGIAVGVRKGNAKKALELAQKAQDEAKLAAEKLAKETAEKAAKEAAEIAAQKAAKEAAEKAAKEATEKAAKEAQAKAAKEAAEKAAKDAEAKAAKEAAEKAAKDAEIKAAKEAEEAAIAEKNRLADLDKSNYKRVLENIEKSKVINKKTDEIMAQPGFDKKITELLTTKVQMQKGKYDYTMIETTLDDVMTGTIKGTYEKPVGNLYHGTNSGSYNDIMKNGFTNDACCITESGKGVYFGLAKGSAGEYSTGGLITAKFTGRKVANVEAGVLGDLGCNYKVRKMFEEKFGLGILKDDSDGIINEIISRAYTNKLDKLGYDAVHTSSIGAGCEYISVLNPKYISIVK